jgi:hypothetical protein
VDASVVAAVAQQQQQQQLEGIRVTAAAGSPGGCAGLTHCQGLPLLLLLLLLLVVVQPGVA